MFEPKEQLPATSCPPDDAIQLNGLYARLVNGDKLAADFCASFHAQGKTTRTHVDPCVWAACSLLKYDQNWTGGPIARILDFAKAAKLLPHKTHVAIMKIDADSGLAKVSEGSIHVSFWMDKNFDPVSAVTDILVLE